LSPRPPLLTLLPSCSLHHHFARMILLCCAAVARWLLLRVWDWLRLGWHGAERAKWLQRAVTTTWVLTGAYVVQDIWFKAAVVPTTEQKLRVGFEGALFHSECAVKPHSCSRGVLVLLPVGSHASPSASTPAYAACAEGPMQC
jgi:hypothetical protein